MLTCPEKRTLRIVFEHRLGPWAGLREITGTTDDFGAQPVSPITSERFQARPDHRYTLAGLVSAHRGHLLYREIDESLPARLR
jgi:hypothetical protein